MHAGDRARGEQLSATEGALEVVAVARDRQQVRGGRQRLTAPKLLALRDTLEQRQTVLRREHLHQPCGDLIAQSLILGAWLNTATRLAPALVDVDAARGHRKRARRLVHVAYPRVLGQRHAQVPVLAQPRVEVDLMQRPREAVIAQDQQLSLVAGSLRDLPHRAVHAAVVLQEARGVLLILVGPRAPGEVVDAVGAHDVDHRV